MRVTRITALSLPSVVCVASQAPVSCWPCMHVLTQPNYDHYNVYIYIYNYTQPYNPINAIVCIILYICAYIHQPKCPASHSRIAFSFLRRCWSWPRSSASIEIYILCNTCMQLNSLRQLLRAPVFALVVAPFDIYRV